MVSWVFFSWKYWKDLAFADRALRASVRIYSRHGLEKQWVPLKRRSAPSIGGPPGRIITIRWCMGGLSALVLAWQGPSLDWASLFHLTYEHYPHHQCQMWFSHAEPTGCWCAKATFKKMSQPLILHISTNFLDLGTKSCQSCYFCFD